MLHISDAPLWETLAARDLKKVDLTAVISSAALKKLQNHEPVSLNVLMKISEALDVPIEKIIEFRHFSYSSTLVNTSQRIPETPHLLQEGHETRVKAGMMTGRIGGGASHFCWRRNELFRNEPCSQRTASFLHNPSHCI